MSKPDFTPAWTPLSSGSKDKVALLFPSSVPEMINTPEEVKMWSNFFQSSWRVEVHNPESLISDVVYGGHIDSPERRAQLIVNALQDENVKFMLFVGGDSGNEVVEHLRKYVERDDFPKRAIPAFGFSDGNVFLNYLSQVGVISPIEGPFLSLMSREPEGVAARSAHKLLFEGKMDDFPLVCVNGSARDYGGKALEGEFVIYDCFNRNSDFRAPLNSDRSLMLLEAGKRGSDVKDHLLRTFRELARLDEFPKAIVLSQSDAKCFNGMKLEDADLTQIQEALAEVKKEMGIDVPVFFGAPYGHSNPGFEISSFTPIPLHTPTVINISADGKASASVDPVMSKARSEELVKYHYERPKFSATNSVVIGEDSDYIVFDPRMSYKHTNLHKFDDLDLKDRKIAIAFPSFPTFAEMKEERGADFPLEAYEADKKGCLNSYFQTLNLTLLYLNHIGKLSDLSEVKIVTGDEVPEGFEEYIANYCKEKKFDIKLSWQKNNEIGNLFSRESDMVAASEIEVRGRSNILAEILARGPVSDGKKSFC